MSVRRLEPKEDGSGAFGALPDAEPIEIATTRGSVITTTDGRRFIDFGTGGCVGNAGWGNPDIQRRLARGRMPGYVAPTYHHGAWDVLAERLVAIAPPGLGRCFRATGGTEAVDLALQAAMLVTGRTGLLSLKGAYHGNSLATLALTGGLDDRIAGALPRCQHISPPFDQRAAERAETTLRHHDIAAFVMEPIATSLGVVIPEREFVLRMRALCKQYGTLFVADEVACGFGRTGTMFACEGFDLEPDLLCLGKAITNGLAPMGAMIATSPVAEVMQKDGRYWSTYGWHPTSVRAALAVLDHFASHGPRLLAHVRTTGKRIVERLREVVGGSAAVRGRGLAIAIAFFDDETAEAVDRRCNEEGLLTGGATGSALTLFPALDVASATVDRALAILDTALTASARPRRARESR